MFRFCLTQYEFFVFFVFFPITYTVFRSDVRTLARTHSRCRGYPVEPLSASSGSNGNFVKRTLAHTQTHTQRGARKDACPR
uniref:Uncharacterized protein n=1 Tax=Anopheles darlingi TaxID=43151 RepID=A0A2M4D1U0_ANODA